MNFKRIFYVLLAAAVIAMLVLWGAHIVNWAWRVTGTANEAGPWYAFWSGFGGSNWFLVLTVSYAYLQHTCHHSAWDLRWGHPIEGTAYRACYRHHPGRKDEHKQKRHVGEDVMQEAWLNRHQANHTVTTSLT